MLGLSSFVYGNAVYSLLDDGITNVLGLETLRHGTSPFNYVSIRLFGGDPNHGAKRTGSTHGWMQDNTENYFYVLKDSEYSPTINYQSLSTLAKIITFPFFIKGIGYRIFSRQHTFFSSYNTTAQLLPSNSSYLAIKCSRVFLGIFGGLVGLCITPTLRFRFSTIDSQELENDSNYHGIAYRTKHKVEAWRIGLLGSIITGINLGWFARAKAHPLKVLTGVAQITCAVALIVLYVHVAVANPIPTIAGALLA
jgi:hypothetical protein